jgi:hypothetical protein
MYIYNRKNPRISNSAVGDVSYHICICICMYMYCVLCVVYYVCMYICIYTYIHKIDEFLTEQ